MPLSLNKQQTTNNAVRVRTTHRCAARARARASPGSSAPAAPACPRTACAARANALRTPLPCRAARSSAPARSHLRASERLRVIERLRQAKASSSEQMARDERFSFNTTYESAPAPTRHQPPAISHQPKLPLRDPTRATQKANVQGYWLLAHG